MMLHRRSFFQLAAGSTILPALPRIASAEGYPSRPIVVVVPSAAGAPSDLAARILLEHLRGVLGQPMVIENVAGANGTIGVGRVARANPDGYTLVLSASSATHVANGAIYALSYDVVADFSPIALIAENPHFILARQSFPAVDLKEMIAWLKANPDRASLGQAGPGSPAHVAGILFQKQTGTRFQFANYRSVSQAMQDLVAGHIDLMFNPLGIEHVRAGRLKAYAVTAKNRILHAPEIPTVDEAGLPGFHASVWLAVWAPKDTPRNLVERLNDAIRSALADTTVRARLTDLAYDIFPPGQQTPEALAAFQKAEIEKWWPIIREAGIKIE